MDPILNIVCILFAVLMAYVGFRHDNEFIGYSGILVTILQVAQLIQVLRTRRAAVKGNSK